MVSSFFFRVFGAESEPADFCLLADNGARHRLLLHDEIIAGGWQGEKQ